MSTFAGLRGVLGIRHAPKPPELKFGTMVRYGKDTSSVFMFIGEQESGYDYEKFAEVRVIQSKHWKVGEHILLDPDELVPID